jgi:DNA-binding NarL/FixJ family response regulator
MNPPTTRDESMSLYGSLRSVLIPQDIGFEDPREIGRALAQRRYDLSRTDIQVLEYVVQGLSNAQIAERMRVVEEGTIKSRLSSIFSKLGVNHRAQAAAIVMKFGFGPAMVGIVRPEE